MRKLCKSLLAAAFLLAPVCALNFFGHARPVAAAAFIPVLHSARFSPLDLAVSGEIPDLPPGTTRYITRDDLLALPQATYAVTDDPNFTGPKQISGVPLEELVRHLGVAPGSDLIVAICSDRYHAHYPREYIAAHHPLLVLAVDGKPPAGWPKDSASHTREMGPYMISHPKFSPSFKILAHQDEPQIPWGVVAIEIRNEKSVFGAIQPRGPHAADALVQDGYKIARQNCFRCHNMGSEGGQKAGYPWAVLAGWAAASPNNFAAYVRHPQAKNLQAEMPGNPAYDDATIRALLAYFQTFAPPESENR